MYTIVFVQMTLDLSLIIWPGEDRHIESFAELLPRELWPTTCRFPDEKEANWKHKPGHPDLNQTGPPSNFYLFFFDQTEDEY